MGNEWFNETDCHLRINMTELQHTKGPKYVALANRFKTQIAQGELKPGDRLPSFTELRAQFGVTPTTVDRVYALLEQESLIVRERGRGTFVREPEARATTGIIGLAGMSLVHQPHPYWVRLMEGLYEAATRSGYELLLLDQSSEIHWEKVDGMINYETQPPLERAMARRLPPYMPCVSALTSRKEGVSVLADDYRGAFEVTQHLLDLGHRRIAYLLDPLSAQRSVGHHDALRQAEIVADARWTRQVHNEIDGVYCTYLEVGHRAMENWLNEDWAQLGCTALVAQNDDTAIGAIRALRAHGLSVPDDVSVTGYDGTEVGQYFSPHLTTVEVPLRKIGVLAVETLVRQMNGENNIGASLILPNRFRAGDSTREPKQL